MPADSPGDLEEKFEVFRAKVEGTNISSQTLLATDYLNHFNEIIMLFGLLPDMPDMIEECKDWVPATYQEHFANSTFSDRDLAIEAYEYVPTVYREAFETTITLLDRLILAAVVRIDNMIKSGTSPEALTETCNSLSVSAQKLMDCASSIIHGSTQTLAQDEIDNLIGG